MKYRPLGATGVAVSSLCLNIGPAQFAKGPAALKALIIAGLEAGINAYHLDVTTPSLLQAAGEALGHVERNLVWISLSLVPAKSTASTPRSFAPEDLTRTIEESLHASGLGWFDVAVLNNPAEDELPFNALSALKAIRSSGQVQMLGIQGEAQVMDTYLSTGAFDALYTPCSVNTDWPVRNRIRAAQRRDMAVFIYDFDRDVSPRPRQPTAPAKKGLFGWLKDRKSDAPAKPVGNFDFLHTTPGWTAPQLCLGLGLTEPAVSSAIINVTTADQIEDLAQVVDRHLPSKLTAQIAMARVEG